MFARRAGGAQVVRKTAKSGRNRGSISAPLFKIVPHKNVQSEAGASGTDDASCSFQVTQGGNAAAREALPLPRGLGLSPAAARTSGGNERATRRTFSQDIARGSRRGRCRLHRTSPRSVRAPRTTPGFLSTTDNEVTSGPTGRCERGRSCRAGRTGRTMACRDETPPGHAGRSSTRARREPVHAAAKSRRVPRRFGRTPSARREAFHPPAEARLRRSGSAARNRSRSTCRCRSPLRRRSVGQTGAGAMRGRENRRTGCHPSMKSEQVKHSVLPTSSWSTSCGWRSCTSQCTATP